MAVVGLLQLLLARAINRCRVRHDTCVRFGWCPCGGIEGAIFPVVAFDSLQVKNVKMTEQSSFDTLTHLSPTTLHGWIVHRSEVGGGTCICWGLLLCCKKEGAVIRACRQSMNTRRRFGRHRCPRAEYFLTSWCMFREAWTRERGGDDLYVSSREGQMK